MGVLLDTPSYPLCITDMFFYLSSITFTLGQDVGTCISYMHLMVSDDVVEYESCLLRNNLFTLY